MKILFALLMFCITSEVLAQKKQIDSEAIRCWESFGPIRSLSNDGKYFLYSINNRPQGHSTLVVQAVNNSWKKEIPNASSLFFSGDSKRIIWRNIDTLHVLKIGTALDDYIINIESIKWPSSGDGEWVAYRLKNDKNELIVFNLITGEKLQFTGVVDYYFESNGKVLLLNVSTASGEDVNSKILLVDLLNSNKANMILDFKSKKQDSVVIGNYLFGESGKNIAFMIREKDTGGISNSIWFYKTGMGRANNMVADKSRIIDSNLLIKYNSLRFSKDGKWLYFKLYHQEKLSGYDPVGSSVEIWSYKDFVLKPEQNKESSVALYDAAIDIDMGKVIRITTGREEVIKDAGCGYLIISDNKSDSSYLWSPAENSYYIVFLKNLSRKLLIRGKKHRFNFSFSPQKKYIIYFDRETSTYYSYDIKADKTLDVSKNISTRLDNEDLYRLPGNSVEVGIAGWLEDDTALLVYDNYDVWKIYPNNGKIPKNITNGYGRKNHIKLRTVDGLSGMFGNPSDIVFNARKTILLTGFHTINKYNGFFKQRLDQVGDPQLLSMGPYAYYIVDSQVPDPLPGTGTIKPIKARDTSIWVLKRMTTTQAPNYYFTTDFKSFVPITDLNPNKNYNWINSELLTWSAFDGKRAEGILYKPEDFDPQRKYPVILCYYEKLSHQMYTFLDVEYSDASINIPWFVSRGYLVFVPDIQYSIASLSNITNGEHAYNYIVSAAKYLSRYSWVDTKRIGINGHSFGGFQTNFLITHTNLFAAAAEASGTSDFVSTYLSLAGTYEKPGNSRLLHHEIEQGRMGCTLWERPDLYIRNSPILRANKVNTPLLIMHNKGDYAVPWSQAVEMFQALRRLGKKVWMLQYNNGDHLVYGKDAIDFTIRLTQFFDHYLKNMPAPRWMTKTIPAYLNGIDMGFELDADYNDH